MGFGVTAQSIVATGSDRVACERGILNRDRSIERTDRAAVRRGGAAAVAGRGGVGDERTTLHGQASAGLVNGAAGRSAAVVVLPKASARKCNSSAAPEGDVVGECARESSHV